MKEIGAQSVRCIFLTITEAIGEEGDRGGEKPREKSRRGMSENGITEAVERSVKYKIFYENERDRS